MSSADDGATMVEYSIMVVLVALLALGLVQVLGLSVVEMYESVVGFF